MTIETGIRVSEFDRMNFNYVLTTLSASMEFITKPLPADMTDEQLDEYYSAIMEQFKQAKIKEHKFRCEFAKKYDIPYDFGYDDGVILIEKED